MRSKTFANNHVAAAAAAAAAAPAANAVNDPPSFAVTNATVTVAENSGRYNATWATNITAGPAETETVAFTITCVSTPAGLFSVAPAVTASGVLSFKLAASASGSSDCAVTLAETSGANRLSANSTLRIVVTEGKRPAMGVMSCGTTE
jgi:hypothetical protein